MKTKKILSTGLVASTIMIASIWSTFAMWGGQGGWHGHGNNNPGNMIAGIPASDLSEKEIEILSYGYSEEMLARDTYNYLAELYPEETVFSKIASSEQKHMDSVEVLLDRYEIDAPTGYGELESTYEALKAQGEISLKDALEVGLQIEVLDIEDIDDAIQNTDNDDFKIVFTNIGGASYNHLRSFLQAFESNGLIPDTQTSEFLSDDDLNTKWPLKYKLAERLEAKGIVLPEQVNSTTLKSKGPNASHTTGNMQTPSGKQKIETAYNKQNYDINVSLKNQYKKTYQVKYGSMIAAMDDDNLETLIEKIDTLSLKVNSGEYSYSVQTKYNAMLLALREIAVENLN